MATEEELFASVDALLEEEPQLPPPAERARLREAAGITQVFSALSRSASIKHALPSAFFTLEADHKEVGMRILSAEARVAHDVLDSSRSTREDTTP